MNEDLNPYICVKHLCGHVCEHRLTYHDPSFKVIIEIEDIRDMGAPIVLQNKVREAIALSKSYAIGFWQLQLCYSCWKAGGKGVDGVGLVGPG